MPVPLTETLVHSASVQACFSFLPSNLYVSFFDSNPVGNVGSLWGYLPRGCDYSRLIGYMEPPYGTLYTLGKGRI